MGAFIQMSQCKTKCKYFGEKWVVLLKIDVTTLLSEVTGWEHNAAVQYAISDMSLPVLRVHCIPEDANVIKIEPSYSVIVAFTDGKVKLSLSTYSHTLIFNNTNNFSRIQLFKAVQFNVAFLFSKCIHVDQSLLTFSMSLQFTGKSGLQVVHQAENFSNF